MPPQVQIYIHISMFRLPSWPLAKFYGGAVASVIIVISFFDVARTSTIYESVLSLYEKKRRIVSSCARINNNSVKNRILYVIIKIIITVLACAFFLAVKNDVTHLWGTVRYSCLIDKFYLQNFVS